MCYCIYCHVLLYLLTCVIVFSDIVLSAGFALHLNNVSGSVYISGLLDREEVPVLEDVMIEARDRGDPHRATTLPLTVYIDDVNDNAPQCRQDHIIVHLPHTPTVGQKVKRTVHAT